MVAIYLLILTGWIIITLAGIFMKKNSLRKIIRIISYVAFLILLIEASCLVGLRVKSKTWLFKEQKNPNSRMFEAHPYLVAVPKKNLSIEVNGKTYSHNSMGFRGKEISFQKTKTRIIALGGSTTYGTSVGDNENWPYYLEQALEGKDEVLNFGVPGYTTVENIIQAELIVPEYHPDIVIIHCGLNDLRNYNIAQLQPDYSDFHAPSFYGSMGLCFENNLPRIATLRVLVLFMQHTGLYPTCSKPDIARKSMEIPDSNAIKLYQRNLYTLCSILKKQQLKIIFVPQVLNYESFKGKKLKWWIPFVSDEDLIKTMDIYNRQMEKVAFEEQVGFAGQILNEKWTKSDFIDPSHLNANANKRFASILAEIIKHL